MKIINGGRRSGKTAKAIQITIETGGILLVRNLHILRLLIKWKPEIKLHIMTYRQFLAGGMKGSKRKLIIDNADEFIQFISHNIGGHSSVEAITLNAPTMTDYIRMERFEK